MFDGCRPVNPKMVANSCGRKARAGLMNHSRPASKNHGVDDNLKRIVVESRAHANNPVCFRSPSEPNAPLGSPATTTAATPTTS